MLLETFARLRRTRPARLMILGDGPERPALEAQARRLGIDADVALIGFVSDPLPYMAQADLFVLSSRYEGLGNVLVEAMAVGCPVVSTDCPSGPREILEDGHHGPLVPVENAEMLAEAMAEHLDQTRRAEDLEAATRRFDSRQIADEMAVRAISQDAKRKYDVRFASSSVVEATDTGGHPESFKVPSRLVAARSFFEPTKGMSIRS
ncbi:hypothetical protein CKO41_15925 [Thiococcus pfennigii]|nr:hypothetical protein [Thiococcus pfennigii]